MKESGFTLLEMMVTVAIVAILAGIGVPSMAVWLKDNRIESEANSLATLLSYARTEAVTRNGVVTLATAAGGSDWSGDIQLYLDVSGGNSAFDSAGGDLLIRSYSSSSSLDIQGSTAAANYISFQSRGRLSEGGNTVALSVCDDRGATHGKTISINLIGRVSVADATDCTP